MASSFSGTFSLFFKSSYMTTLLGGLFVGGIYVTYKDNSRYTKIVHVFHTGCILAPFKENNYEVKFVSRKILEAKLRDIMNGNFTKQFYILSGQIGAGKSRLVLETTRALISEHLAHEAADAAVDAAETDAAHHSDHKKFRCGAPIYVSAAQGSVFADTLAEAVNFQFDEHISLPAFVDSAFGISTISNRESGANRLSRVLNAIEISAYMFVKKYKSQVVLVIDSIENLSEPDLALIFTKAKFWADANIVKLIFVTNNRKVNELLHLIPSNLARANFSLVFGDLTKDEAFQFLQNPHYMETKNIGHIDPCIPEDIAEKIYFLVGGRMSHLVRVKRLWTEGYCWDDIETIIKNREMDKFRHLSNQPKSWKAVSLLRTSPKNRILYSKLIKETSVECLNLLEQHNIIALRYRPEGVVVSFQSRLTKVLIDEQEKAWEEQKLLMNKEHFIELLARAKKQKAI